MRLNWNPLKSRSPRPSDVAALLYRQAVDQARSPAFYGPGRTPDTVEGRFEVILLHVYLLVRRLKQAPEAADVSQALFDTFFDDMDAALREIGVGDLVVGKKIKKMGEAFYGRAKAYEDAFAVEGDADAMAQAVRRNVLIDAQEPTQQTLADFAQYIQAADVRLTAASLEDVLSGKGDVFPNALAA